MAFIHHSAGLSAFEYEVNDRSNDVAFSELLGNIKGGISLEEGLFLRRLSGATPIGCIVEIGSFRGKSAVALAAGAQMRGKGTKPNIYCIDPHKAYLGFYGGQFGPDDRGAFFETMLKTGYYRDVSLINMPSESVAPMWCEPVGLLFIDGEHSYESVRRDFYLWSKHVLPDGVIAFDDATDPNCGPHRVIKEIMPRNEYREIARCGKIVAFKKLDPTAAPTPPRFGGRTRILVACDRPVLSGGFLRMERIAEQLIAWGHEVAYVAFGEANRSDLRTKAPVLTFEDCSDEYWHSVIVPGAGFPAATISAFSKLRGNKFGTRVQMILNDTSLRGLFIEVNRALEPHLVVFNNNQWEVGSFTDFSADKFHVLEGAVDTTKFRPWPYRESPSKRCTCWIGGLASKNPAPLIEALRLLSPRFHLRLFGPDSYGLSTSAADLIAEGLLELTGPIFDNDLHKFYDDIDIVCMTEEHAGWSNLVAEAMASGLPVICTPKGTSAVAIDGATAIVIERPAPHRLAEEIRSLADDSSRCVALGRAARQKIEDYDWAAYSRKLLALTFHDGRKDYYHAPELGLYGKWPIALRLVGLEQLIMNCQDMTVLDLGAAEGLVARAFLESRAALVHGFELDALRAKQANNLVRSWTGSFIRAGDITNWSALTAKSADLQSCYDIVLYLGIHHHLSPSLRLDVLRMAASYTRHYLVLRMPATTMIEDRLHQRLIEEGFQIFGETTPPCSGAGETRIYKKT